MTTHHLDTNDDIVDENDACSHLYEPVDRMEAISARVAEGDRDTLELEMRNEECLTENVAYQVAKNEWRFQVEVEMNLEAREGGIIILHNPAYQVTKSTGRFQVEHGDGSGTCISTPVGCMQEESSDIIVAPL